MSDVTSFLLLAISRFSHLALHSRKPRIQRIYPSFFSSKCLRTRTLIYSKKSLQTAPFRSSAAYGKTTNARLARLFSIIVVVSYQWRTWRRIIREMHDDVGQKLADQVRHENVKGKTHYKPASNPPRQPHSCLSRFLFILVTTSPAYNGKREPYRRTRS